jgi:hypothetical protein
MPKLVYEEGDVTVTTCKLIDVPIPADRNVVQKEREIS